MNFQTVIVLALLSGCLARPQLDLVSGILPIATGAVGSVVGGATETVGSALPGDVVGSLLSSSGNSGLLGILDQLVSALLGGQINIESITALLSGATNTVEGATNTVEGAANTVGSVVPGTAQIVPDSIVPSLRRRRAVAH